MSEKVKKDEKQQRVENEISELYQGTIQFGEIYAERSKQNKLYFSGWIGKVLRVMCFQMKDDVEKRFTFNIKSTERNSELICVGVIKPKWQNGVLFFIGNFAGNKCVFVPNPMQTTTFEPSYYIHLIDEKVNHIEKEFMSQGELMNEFA